MAEGGPAREGPAAVHSGATGKPSSQIQAGTAISIGPHGPQKTVSDRNPRGVRVRFDSYAARLKRARNTVTPQRVIYPGRGGGAGSAYNISRILKFP